MLKPILAAALLAAGASVAEAHATLETEEAALGSSYKAVLRVPHGCEGEATLKVRVRIPEGVIAVKPMPKAGWTLETIKEPYAQAYDYYGTELTEGVVEIVWTGELLDEHYDEFVFRGMITETLEPGGMLYFPDRAGMRHQVRALDRDPGRGPGPGRARRSGPGGAAAARVRRRLTRKERRCGRFSRCSASRRSS